ncbi:MAG: hypothetical protein KC800_17575 [Candidatus Eremiobacteraeota bacterium]|nr:hypothetical protein [Candidatus Eremiobacteraeota bacterium]
MRINFKTLLCLLAMGNWVSSHTPPLDEDAPEAVGNAGTLDLQGDGEMLEFSLQPMKLYQSSDVRLLRIEGEPASDGPGLLLLLDVSDVPKLSEQPAHEVEETPALGGKISSGPWPEPVTVKSGRITITSATGSGPWEVDADVALQTSKGPFTGKLQARLE